MNGNKLANMIDAYAHDAAAKIDFEVSQVQLADSSTFDALDAVSNAISTVRDMLHKQIEEATALLMQAVQNAATKAHEDYSSVAASLEATKAEILHGEVERLPGKPVTRAERLQRVDEAAAAVRHATTGEATPIPGPAQLIDPNDGEIKI